MEKLTAAQQQQVKKMSDERLRIKLIGAGYEEEHVLRLEREALLATYAEHLASGKPTAGSVEYDPTVDRKRLAFEREKWEAERQFEKEKWEAEGKKGDVKKKLSRKKRDEENF